MAKGGLARGLGRAEGDNNYSATMNIAVINEGGSAGDNNIECNIIAKDDSEEIILSHLFSLAVETNPDMQVVMDMEVNESTSGDGQLESTLNKVETTDETGKTETLPDDKIEEKKNDVELEIFPGDWETGNSEDIEIGEPGGAVRPGGTEEDWGKGENEDVVVGD